MNTSVFELSCMQCESLHTGSGCTRCNRSRKHRGKPEDMIEISGEYERKEETRCSQE